jgi:hypothetical protein
VRETILFGYGGATPSVFAARSGFKTRIFLRDCFFLGSFDLHFPLRPAICAQSLAAGTKSQLLIRELMFPIT